MKKIFYMITIMIGACLISCGNSTAACDGCDTDTVYTDSLDSVACGVTMDMADSIAAL